MANQPSYSELKDELADILAKMSASGVDIDAATKYYERGLKIISELEKQLKAAETKVKRLKINRPK